MPDYIIATTSTSDLPRTWLDEHQIPFLSYTFTINETAAEDDCREENREKIYAGMRKGDLLTTSMINAFVYEDFFRQLLGTGKNVLFLDMSEKMSKSYQNCQSAAETVRSEFPDRRLVVMDTRCISGGLGLLSVQGQRCFALLNMRQTYALMSRIRSRFYTRNGAEEFPTHPRWSGLC